MIERSLNVFLEAVQIGRLTEQDGLWRFSYDPVWLTNHESFAIAPGLPLGSDPIIDTGSQRPVQWFFDNLLPEEALRERLAKERKLSSADAFGLLEAYGLESAGSLTLLAPGASIPPPGRKPLSDRELAQRIRDLPRASLEAKAPKKMSLAGGQHKLPVIVDNDKLFEPEGSEPSTHILKPDHREADRYPHSTANEWFCMQLAARFELIVPPTHHRYCPEPIYLIERFDRRKTGQTTRRLHAIDACQLLNLDRTFKYQQMTLDVLGRICDETRSRAYTRLRLFRWCVFNIMTGNADAHLKNLSFIVDADGIELAPFYDLLTTAAFEAERPARWAEVPMSMQVGNASRFGQVSRETIFLLAEHLRITRAGVERTLDEFLRRMPDEAATLQEKFSQHPRPKAATASRGGELHVMRHISHLVIRDMCRRLGK